MVWATSALISLTRIYNVSADPPVSPLYPCSQRMLSTTPYQCQPWTNFVLSGEVCALGWAHYVPKVTSDLWLWSLPVGPNWDVFLFFLSFEAPLKHCRLSVGLAKLEYMCASSPLRAVPVFRNSLFEHNVLTALLMVWIPIDNKTRTRLSSHVLRSHSLSDQLKQISL